MKPNEPRRHASSDRKTDRLVFPLPWITGDPSLPCLPQCCWRMRADLIEVEADQVLMSESCRERGIDHCPIPQRSADDTDGDCTVSADLAAVAQRVETLEAVAEVGTRHSCSWYRQGQRR